MSRRIWLLVVVVLCVAIEAGSQAPKADPAAVAAAKKRMAENTAKAAEAQKIPDRIVALVKKQGLPINSVSTELKDRNMVAIIEIPKAQGASAEAIGRKVLLAIRNDFYKEKRFEFYRVSVRGPSPGPDLVLQYGSARFTEGGSLEWSPAK